MENKLESLIRQIGEVALSLHDPLENGISFPLVGESLDLARKSIDYIIGTLQNSEFRLLPAKFKGTNKEFMAIATVNRSLSLAGRMFDHDLAQDYFLTKLASDMEVNEDLERSPKCIEDFLHTLVNLRLFLLTMAYIGTEETRYLTEIRTDQIQMLLRAKYNSEIDVGMTADVTDKTIRNDIYVSICQLVKNSWAHKYIGIRPEIKVTLDYAKSPSGSAYKIAAVQDNANGFGTLEGVPLNKEQIRDVFGEYSLTGGGLGGQLVAHVIDMANKRLKHKSGPRYDVDIIFKVEGSEMIYYDRHEHKYAAGLQDINEIALSPYKIPPAIPAIEHGSIIRLFNPE
jgi:hypothetical protein